MVINGNIKTIFDWVKEITVKKRDKSIFTDTEWVKFDSYMINRFLSMNPDIIEVINIGQSFPPEDKKQLYDFYREYIPKNGRWFKYIKPTKSKYNKELIENISYFNECSKREAIDALDIISKPTVKSILKSMGKDEKEIKKLLK